MQSASITNKINMNISDALNLIKDKDKALNALPKQTTKESVKKDMQTAAKAIQTVKNTMVVKVPEVRDKLKSLREEAINDTLAAINASKKNDTRTVEKALGLVKETPMKVSEVEKSVESFVSSQKERVKTEIEPSINKARGGLGLSHTRSQVTAPGRGSRGGVSVSEGE